MDNLTLGNLKTKDKILHKWQLRRNRTITIKLGFLLKREYLPDSLEQSLQELNR